jgi:SAM-dependent methyltransferase
MPSKLEKWNDAYQDADISSAKPAEVLLENLHLLPIKGNALDLACGRAGNAILLAKRGFNVDAVDISPLVLKSVDEFVTQHRLSVSCKCRDLEKEGLFKKKYDVIVVSYFLNRALFPQIIRALKPNGLLFYETWSQQKIDETGPKNPDFRLKSGELFDLTPTLRPIFYREEGASGNVSKGFRNIAMIVAQNIELNDIAG